MDQDSIATVLKQEIETSSEELSDYDLEAAVKEEMPEMSPESPTGSRSEDLIVPSQFEWVDSGGGCLNIKSESFLNGSNPLEDTSWSSQVNTPPNDTEQSLFGKRFSCSGCNYSTSHKFNLTRHMKRHTGEKPFSCTRCDYSTYERNHLTTHIMRHDGVKPFQCTQCDYSTPVKSSMTVHMKRHSGEKPFSCMLCDYAALRKSDITLHMRRKHEDYKPFSCSYCDYRSSYKRDVTIHTMVHTGEIRFSCPRCNYWSSNESSLIQHMRRHRNDKPKCSQLVMIRHLKKI